MTFSLLLVSHLSLENELWLFIIELLLFIRLAIHLELRQSLPQFFSFLLPFHLPEKGKHLLGNKC